MNGAPDEAVERSLANSELILVTPGDFLARLEKLTRNPGNGNALICIVEEHAQDRAHRAELRESLVATIRDTRNLNVVITATDDELISLLTKTSMPAALKFARMFRAKFGHVTPRSADTRVGIGILMLGEEVVAANEYLRLVRKTCVASTLRGNNYIALSAPGRN